MPHRAHTEQFLFEHALSKALPAALGTLVLISVSAFQTLSLYQAPSPGLWIALAGAALCLVRAWLCIRLHLAKKNGASKRYQREAFKILLWLARASALHFSVWVGFLLHSFGSSHPAFLFSLIIVSGLASAATGSLATHPSVFAQYVTLLFSIWLPQGMLYRHEADFFLFAVISVAFLAFLSQTTQTLHQALRSQAMMVWQARREARQAQSYLQALPGFVSVLDQDLNYTFISKTLRSAWGLTDGNEIARKLGWRDPDSEFVKKLKEFARGNLAVDDFVTELRLGPDNSFRHHQVYLSRVTDLEVFLCLAIDVEEKVRLEQERSRDRSKMEHSSRLASLGEMAAGIAHEINNPLAIIAGATSFLPRCREDLPKFEAKIATIQNAVERISKIVRAMRVFGRQGDPVETQLKSMDAVVEDVIGLCGERMRGKGIELRLSLHSPTLAQLPEVALGQILINLLNNAIDAIEGQDSPWISLETREHGNQCVIRIIDSGKGIPPEIREKIMNPFFTTKPVGKGTGLGLSVSLKLAETIGGRLELDSRCENTCFTIQVSLGKIQRAA